MQSGRLEVVPSTQWGPKLRALKGQRFVLCVCTIEARKNHAYLLNIWQRMIAEGLEVPDLVFVGRIGWRVTDLMAQIEASQYLNGQLHILHGISDAKLAALYEECLFTVFPSFVEGWGLPVGESLSHGKVCVASSTSSIPEVGGDLVLYVDPFDQNSGYDIIRRLITDPVYLAGKEADVRARFRARTWEDVGKDFFGKIAATISDLPPLSEHVFAPSLRAGDLLDMNQIFHTLLPRPDYMRNPVRLIFSSGWRMIEATGTWLDLSGQLRFQTDYAPCREVVALLQLSSSPWVTENNRLHVWLSETPLRRNDHGTDRHVLRSFSAAAGTKFWIKVKGIVGEDGAITVQFQVDGEVNALGDNLPVAVRLHAIGYAACDDIAARLDLLESKALTE